MYKISHIIFLHNKSLTVKIVICFCIKMLLAFSEQTFELVIQESQNMFSSSTLLEMSSFRGAHWVCILVVGSVTDFQNFCTNIFAVVHISSVPVEICIYHLQVSARSYRGDKGCWTVEERGKAHISPSSAMLSHNAYLLFSLCGVCHVLLEGW